MSLPKNNLAEQMALLQKKNLKSMLKRKRQSDPITSQSKRPSFGLSTSSLPNTPPPSSSSSFLGSNRGLGRSSLSSERLKVSPKPGDVTISPKSGVINLSDDEKRAIAIPVEDDDDDDFEPLRPSQAKIKKPTPPKPTNRSIFDEVASRSSNLIFGGEDDIPPPPPPPPPRKCDNTRTQFDIRAEDLFDDDDPPPPPPPKPKNTRTVFNICADELFGDDESFSEQKVTVDPIKENVKKSQTSKGSLFDTTSEYDLYDAPTSGSPVKSERSLAETIAEFGLLEKKNMSTQKPATHQSNLVKQQTTLTSRLSSLTRQPSSKLLSPEKSSGVMVKVQPTKGVKKNVVEIELGDTTDAKIG